MSIFPGDAGYEYNRLRKENINIKNIQIRKRLQKGEQVI